MFRVVLFPLFLSFFSLIAEAVEINLLLLFAITREETVNSDLVRIYEPGNTAAFLAAAALIEQFNNDKGSITDSTFVCDDVTFEFVLADTKADFSHTLGQFITDESADLNAFDIILGPSRSTTCIPVSFATSPLRIPVISPTCTTPELNDPVSHPRILRTVPSDDFTAAALVEALIELPKGVRSPDTSNSINALSVYAQVAVLYQEDSYGSKYKDSIFESSQTILLPNDTKIDFHFFPFKPEDSVSIELAVNASAETELNIFVGIFNLESMRDVVDAAIKAKTIGEGRLWIFSDGVLGDTEIANDFQNNAEILSFVQNNYMVQGSSREIPASNTFKSQFMTDAGGYNVNALSEVLADAVGDRTNFGPDFFRRELNSVAGNPSDFALFGYDSLLAVRQFVDNFQIENGCDTPVDFSTFVSTLKGTDFEFPGVTGTVKFNSDGSRAVDTATAKLIRLNFESTDVAGTIGGVFDSQWTFIEENILFNGGSNSAPLMVDPPEEVTVLGIESGIQTVMNVTAGLIVFAVICLYVFIYKSRNRNVIKAAQPFFLSVMLFGVIISSCSVFFTRNSSDETEDDSFRSIGCNAPFILISLGLTVTFSALVFKLQRVAVVANTTPELRNDKVYSIWDSIRMMLVVIAINIALLIVVNEFDPLEQAQVTSEEDDFGQAIEIYEVCKPQSGNGLIYGLLIAFHLIFYLYAFRLIFKTKDMSTDFQEGKWIAFSVIAQFQLFALGVPVVIAVGAETAGIRFLVIALIVHFSNIVLLLLIFAPKVYRVVIGDDDVVWSDKNDLNSGIMHYSSNNNNNLKAADSRHYQDVRKSLYNTMATQDFGHEATL